MAISEDEELSRVMLEEARRDGVAAYEQRRADMARWGIREDSPIGELMLAGAAGSSVLKNAYYPQDISVRFGDMEDGTLVLTDEELATLVPRP